MYWFYAVYIEVTKQKKSRCKALSHSGVHGSPMHVCFRLFAEIVHGCCYCWVLLVCVKTAAQSQPGVPEAEHGTHSGEGQQLLSHWILSAPHTLTKHYFWLISFLEKLLLFFFCLAGKCKHFKLALRSVCSYESTLGSSVGVFRTCLKPDVTVKGRYRNNCVPDFKPAQSETETNAFLSWEVLEHAH